MFLMRAGQCIKRPGLGRGQGHSVHGGLVVSAGRLKVRRSAVLQGLVQGGGVRPVRPPRAGQLHGPGRYPELCGVEELRFVGPAHGLTPVRCRTSRLWCRLRLSDLATWPKWPAIPPCPSPAPQ